MAELAETSWEASNSAFRQVFTSRFIPGATPEQLQWFNESTARSLGTNGYRRALVLPLDAQPASNNARLNGQIHRL
jgi:hypothetical protein